MHAPAAAAHVTTNHAAAAASSSHSIAAATSTAAASAAPPGSLASQRERDQEEAHIAAALRAHNPAPLRVLLLELHTLRGDAARLLREKHAALETATRSA